MQKNHLTEYDTNLKHQQDELALAYLPAVKAMAYRLKERLPSFIDTIDLISIGAEVLVKLARRYDKNLNDSFWGYSKKRVYGSMLDYLRSLDIVSRSSRRLIKAIDRTTEEYMHKHEEAPSNEYLAEVLEEPLKKIKDAKIASDIYTLMPLNEQLATFGNPTTESIEQEELIDIIKNTLSDMGEREQLIIQLYYFEELSLKEISDVLNITQSRISQIHKSVIKKVKDNLGNDIDG